MKKTTRITNDDQITASGWTPYDGIVEGAPVMSLIEVRS
jgi:hypothetical protein